MPTTKKRINITLNDPLYRALSRLSEEEKRSLSGLCLHLIERALELEEDLYFSHIADKRLAQKEKRIPHAKAWDE
ncbi:MAG: antitoxin, RHH family protein [Deltaproteobacteria bacterium]|nr:antitoxin, RHH family protein [Deltaproteobacteria bacterium]